MTTRDALRDRLRLELGDQARPFEAQARGGNFNRFDLPVQFVQEGTENVLIDNVVQVLNTDYEMDYLNGVITLTDPLASGTTLTVDGYNYEAFVDSELDQFLDTAMLQHNHGVVDGAGDPITYATLPGVEEYLVVINALIQALWAAATDQSRQIDINVPDGVSIPEGQRFQQIMAMIQYWTSRYQELSALLNVGLGRIQMFTLRRVSRSTNRLVPVYVAQEYDDTTPPVRVLPPIDQGL